MTGKKSITEGDLKDWPVWKWDDVDDVYTPVIDNESYPELDFYIFVRALFTTPHGIEIPGYLVGTINPYAVGLCQGEFDTIINRNLPDLALPDLQELIFLRADMSGLRPADLLPLTYVSQTHALEENELRGVFDMDLRSAASNT